MPRHTFGIFLLDRNDKLLVATATGADKKSMTIPKGGKEEGENDFEAACREFLEEAGVEIRDYAAHWEKVYTLPPVKYKSGSKQLYSFLIKLDIPLDDVEFKCLSYTSKGFPEVYNHRLVKIENAKQHLQEAQVRAFENYEIAMWFIEQNNLIE